MIKDYYRKTVILFLILSAMFEATNVFAEPGIAAGPYVVNFQMLANTTPDVASPTSPTEIHWHQVPTQEKLRLVPSRADKFPPSQSESSQASPLPALDFEGWEQTGPLPPGTNGAVSGRFVLTTANNAANIRDRKGNLLTAVNLDNFWAPTGTTGNAFDTRSRFDPVAERFIIMSAGALGDPANSSILLAVSQTGDPTGNWNLYRVPADPVQQQRWADYPTIGFNAKWIAVHANLFPAGDSGMEFTTRLWAFDKADLYDGKTATFTVLPGLGVTAQPADTHEANLDDLYFLQQPTEGAVSLYRLSGAVGAESTALVATVTTPLTWTGNIPSAPQLGTAQRISPGFNWMMDTVYRNGAIWGTQIVEPTTGPSRTAVQWLRISTQGQLLDFGRIDDPTGAVYYGFPSIAVNANNDALIGYTRFSADAYPGAGYAFRAATDPAGTFQQEIVYKSGLTPYDNGRWGDYSRTQVDPVNDRDFWTVQEITGNNGWSTWWAKVAVPSTAANISVQFKWAGEGPATSLHPRFKVTNIGDTGLNLGGLALRYWFNCDCAPPATEFEGVVDWAGFMPSGQSITSRLQISFEPASSGHQTHVMVVRFVSDSPTLVPGQSVEIHTRLNREDWGNMPSANDWSYAPFTSFTGWNRVAGYINGSLVWGQEP